MTAVKHFRRLARRRDADANIKAHGVDDISERHREVIRLIVRGLNNIEIGEKVGITASRVSIIRNDPLVRTEVARLSGQEDMRIVLTRDRLTDMTKTCLDTLQGIIEDEDGVPSQVRASASLKVLEMAGVSKKGPETVHVHKHEHLSVNQIDIIRNSVDADYEEVVNG